jgi:hypothetical protein
LEGGGLYPSYRTFKNINISALKLVGQKAQQFLLIVYRKFFK